MGAIYSRTVGPSCAKDVGRSQGAPRPSLPLAAGAPGRGPRGAFPRVLLLGHLLDDQVRLYKSCCCTRTRPASNARTVRRRKRPDAIRRSVSLGEPGLIDPKQNDVCPALIVPSRWQHPQRRSAATINLNLGLNPPVGERGTKTRTVGHFEERRATLSSYYSWSRFPPRPNRWCTSLSGSSDSPMTVFIWNARPYIYILCHAYACGFHALGGSWCLEWWRRRGVLCSTFWTTSTATGNETQRRLHVRS